MMLNICNQYTRYIKHNFIHMNYIYIFATSFAEYLFIQVMENLLNGGRHGHAPNTFIYESEKNDF